MKTSLMDILRDIVRAIETGEWDKDWAGDMYAKIDAVEEHLKADPKTD